MLGSGRVLARSGWVKNDVHFEHPVETKNLVGRQQLLVDALADFSGQRTLCT